MLFLINIIFNPSSLVFITTLHEKNYLETNF